MAQDNRSNATKRIAREVKKGEALGIRDLTDVDSVTNKEEAIAHLKNKDIPTEFIEQMEGNQARKAVDKIAGDAGYIYPNYRPL